MHMNHLSIEVTITNNFINSSKTWWREVHSHKRMRELYGAVIGIGKILS